MNTKKESKDIIKERLAEIYDKLSLPALFVTKTFRLYYYNPAASVYFPDLCKPLGLKPFIKAEKLTEDETSAKSGNIFVFESNKFSAFSTFILAPLYSSKSEPVCYRVQVATSCFKDEKLQRIISNVNIINLLDKKLQAPVEKISKALQQCKNKISSNLEEIYEIEDALYELLAIEESIQKLFIDEREWDTEERTFFNIYELLSEISEATGFIKITKESYPGLNGASAYGRKTAIGHVLLKMCRYLLLEAEEKGKITVRMKISCDKAIISMSRKISDSTDRKPFEVSINKNMNKINYGLEDARKGIEKEGGNLIARNNKNRVEVKCSIPCMTKDPSTYTLTDATGFDSFDKLKNVLDDVRSLYESLPKQSKK